MKELSLLNLEARLVFLFVTCVTSVARTFNGKKEGERHTERLRETKPRIPTEKT